MHRREKETGRTNTTEGYHDPGGSGGGVWSLGHLRPIAIIYQADRPSSGSRLDSPRQYQRLMCTILPKTRVNHSKLSITEDPRVFFQPLDG